MKNLLLFTGMIFFLVSTAFAQDNQKPKKYENVTWCKVVKIDFKPGQTWRAKQIIKMYEAAGVEAGTKGPEKYWFSTGKYDVMVIWKMEDGPGDMEWSLTEDNIKWRNAMIKQVGSEEKFKEIQKEYSSLVSSSTSDVCRKQLD